MTGRSLVLATLLMILGTILFWPAREQGFFILDDQGYVSCNAQVLSGLTADNIRWAFTSFHDANWHPLTWLSHMADIQLFGLDPAGHHLTSVLLHAVNGGLLLLLLTRLTGSVWRSALVAAIFALHPLRVESVAWIAERKDVLAGLFWITTLLAYSYYARRPSVKLYLLTLALFACGLMAKPMLVTLPFIMLLLDFWPLARWSPHGDRQLSWPSSRLLLEKLPFLLLTLVSCIITFKAQQAGGSVIATEMLPFQYRVGNSLVAYAAYIYKSLWPTGLAVFYPLSLPVPFWRIGSAMLLLSVISVVVYRWRSRRPWLVVGWLWYLGALVPVIGLVHVGLQAMADRYTYLPGIGLSLMLVWSLPQPALKAPRTAMALGGVLLITLLALLSRQQLSLWHDNATILSHTVAVTRDNHLAECYLGDALMDQGKAQEAIPHYNRSLQLKPFQPNAHNGLGMAMAQLGNLDRAVVHYNAAIKLRPNHSEALYNLGVVMVMQGDTRGAEGHFRQALRYQPDFIEAWYALGRIQAGQGRDGDAVTSFQEVVRLQPFHAGARQALQQYRPGGM
jgi:hypothetical protein